MQEFTGIESRDPNPWSELFTLTLACQATKVAMTPKDEDQSRVSAVLC